MSDVDESGSGVGDREVADGGAVGVRAGASDAGPASPDRATPTADAPAAAMPEPTGSVTPAAVPPSTDGARPDGPVASRTRRRLPSPRATRRVLRSGVGVALAALLVAGGVALDRTGAIPGSPTTQPATADPSASSPQFQLIQQAWDLIHAQYVDRAHLDDTSLADAGIAAITDAIGDTGHTSFETPTDLAAENAVLNGHYVGIGIALGTASGGAQIGRVFPDSPAAGAGLGVGDLIVDVDGKDISGLTLPVLVGLIEGPAGSPVTLTVRPAAGGSERDVVLVRAPVTIPVVESAIVPGTQIADIRLEQFSDGATEALVEAVKAAVADGAKGIILDLRGNPGGLVSEAVAVASQFIGTGNVYQTLDVSGHQDTTPVQPGGVALDVPLVVLVDHDTASAAEIVASALQDAQRATIVGQTTFGTGTILGQFNLTDGSALRIGTLEWLTRNGRSVWHAGLVPDEVVALATGVQPIAPSDLQRLTAAQVAAEPDQQFHAALVDAQRVLPSAAP
jgi:carboxyl-terminal processing protease